MEEKKTDTMIRINPRTGRNIIIGGKVWKSLTEEEKQKANNLFKKFNIEPIEFIPPIEPTKSHTELFESIPTIEPTKSHTEPIESIPTIDMDDNDDYPIYKIDTAKSSAYIQNILTKTKEAEDRVKFLLYRRFFESEDGW